MLQGGLQGMGRREIPGTRLLITSANEIKKYYDKKKLLFILAE